MAKWTLDKLDGGGWGVGGVTTVCGRDWTGLYSCRMLRATMDYLNTTLRTEIKLQPISEIDEQISKVLQFNSPLNKQVLDVV